MCLSFGTTILPTIYGSRLELLSAKELKLSLRLPVEEWGCNCNCDGETITCEGLGERVSALLF